MSNQSNTFKTLTTAFTIAASAAGLSYYWLAKRPLPTIDGHTKLTGLHEPVEIIRDKWGVPHIYAQNEHDLLFAQGYTHAQDRLWQMDFNRRLVAGRLAEIIGPKALPLDRWLRTLTFYRTAQAEVPLIETQVRTAYDAYIAGVNAFITLGHYPLECTLLRYQPEPWTLVDMLAWIKMMAWTLSINWETEILRAQIINHLGPEKAAQLDVDHAYLDPNQPPNTIIPPHTPYNPLGQSALDRATHARTTLGPTAHDGAVGSNSWVVNGQHTTTGAPLLANDMHLGMSQPAIWYENHLITPQLNTTGVTFPGLPFIVSGHNGHVTWGFTNAFVDVQDIYRQRLKRTADNQVLYQYDDQWLPATVYQEEIKVKDAPSVTEEVIVTRHGPIINNLSPDFIGEEPLALCWTALQPNRMISGLYHTAYATDIPSLRQAFRTWAAPPQNAVMADDQGNIAYSLIGHVPQRKQGNGRLPRPGWTSQYDWLTQYLPFEQHPHLDNPEQGFIVTANNKIVDDTYPHHLSDDYLNPARAQRITAMIRQQNKIDIPYMQKMHYDTISPTAKIIAQTLTQLTTNSPQLNNLLTHFRDWDGDLTIDSIPAAIYEVFIRQLILTIYRPHLGSDLAARLAGKGPIPVLAEGTLYGDHSWVWLVQQLATNNDSPWFTPHGGRQAALEQALQATLDFLLNRFGPDINQWRWGKLHQILFSHQLGANPQLAKLFNRGPFPMPGDNNTPYATGTGIYNLDSQKMTASPYRMIIDTQNWSNSVSLLGIGQSGHVTSPYYDNQLDDWLNGRYHPMPFTRQDLFPHTAHTLYLIPK